MRIQNENGAETSHATPEWSCSRSEMHEQDAQKQRRGKSAKKRANNKPTQKEAMEVNHPPTLEHKCCNTVSIYHSATEQARRRMSQSKFAKERKEWLNRPYLNEKTTKYNLSSNQDGCREESHNECIRVIVERPAYHDNGYHAELTGMVRHCSNIGTKEKKDDAFKFWKHQLSTGFFKGNAPPRPLLTTSMMQRYKVGFCFECHASNTIEEWIEGHVGEST